MVYKRLLRPLLFALDPERAHAFSLVSLRLALSLPLFAPLLRASFNYSSRRLNIEVAGLPFASPVGLAAGFDKSGRFFPALSQIGFGAIECGSFTAHSQAGNRPPRLFRFPAEGALVNRMGFNNPGAEEVAHIFSRQDFTPKQLSQRGFRPFHRSRKEVFSQKKFSLSLPMRSGKFQALRGINIGKSKAADLDRAIEDYLFSLRLLVPYADWLTLNVSSPNTPGLRKLQFGQRLSELVGAVQAELSPTKADKKPALKKPPLFVKIAPDLKDRELEQVLDILSAKEVAGIIVGNSSLDKSAIPAAAALEGGLSGRPLRSRSNLLIEKCYRLVGNQLAIVGVGGIDSGEAALEKISLGASLIQLYSGLVFEGPTLPARINRFLDRFLERENCSLQDLIGSKIRVN